MASFRGVQASGGSSSTSYDLGSSFARVAGGGAATYGAGAARLGLGFGGGGGYCGVALGQGGLWPQSVLGASQGYAVGHRGALALGACGMGPGGWGGAAFVPYGSPAFVAGRSMMSGGLAGGPLLSPLSVAAPPPLATRDVNKATLRGLNQRFSGYVEKVRLLQRENAALEAQLKALTGDVPVSLDGDLVVDYEERVTELRSTLETLILEKANLEVEADNVRASAEELQAKYEFETTVRQQLQADIESMKKDIELATDAKVTLTTKLTSLTEELAFLKVNYEEEMVAYRTRLGLVESTSSLIEVDTERSVDVTAALSRLRSEYEEAARAHRDDAAAYYARTMEQIQESTVQTTETIASLKTELSSVHKEVHSHYVQLQSVLSENYSLEQRVATYSARSSTSVASCQSSLASLEVAIATAKSDLQRQLAAYQTLLDVKLALDAEIATYRRLLEGEADILSGTNITLSGVKVSSTSPGGSSISSSHTAAAATAASAKAATAAAAAAAATTAAATAAAATAAAAAAARAGTAVAALPVVDVPAVDPAVGSVLSVVATEVESRTELETHEEHSETLQVTSAAISDATL